MKDRVDSDLPPVWRIRKVGEHWTVLRLQPIRHVFYIPIATLKTHKDAMKWLCVRVGECPPEEIPDTLGTQRGLF